MTEQLQVEKRQRLGTAAAQRLRREGKIPAVLYGHGQENQHLAVAVTEVEQVLRHHSQMVSLGGAVSDHALISDVQWDPLGIDVMHLDLIRVNLKENVEVSVPIHMHGEAAGARAGGVLLESMHEVEIRCSAGSIPESLEVDVNEMEIGDQRIAGDLELPAGVELVTPAEAVVVRVDPPPAEAEPEVAGEAAEPEVIAEGESEGEGAGEESES